MGESDHFGLQQVIIQLAEWRDLVMRRRITCHTFESHSRTTPRNGSISQIVRLTTLEKSMNQLDPNAGANAQYRMDARLEAARRRRLVHAAEESGENSSTVGRVSRSLKALVTRSTTRLRGRRSLGTMRARARKGDVGVERPRRPAFPAVGSSGTPEPELVIQLVDAEERAVVELAAEPEIARSGHGVVVNKL